MLELLHGIQNTQCAIAAGGQEAYTARVLRHGGGRV
jgi:hypothetical protein